MIAQAPPNEFLRMFTDVPRFGRKLNTLACLRRDRTFAENRLLALPVCEWPFAKKRLVREHAGTPDVNLRANLRRCGARGKLTGAWEALWRQVPVRSRAHGSQLDARRHRACRKRAQRRSARY